MESAIATAGESVTEGNNENVKCLLVVILQRRVQSGYKGCNTGNRKKRSTSRAQPGQATCLAVASFLSISCVTSYVATLYISHSQCEVNKKTTLRSSPPFV